MFWKHFLLDINIIMPYDALRIELDKKMIYKKSRSSDSQFATFIWS